MLLKILLLPFKFVVKVVGYLFVGILKLIGFLFEALANACGWVTNLIGSIITLLGVVYLVCGFLGVANLNTIELWWVAGVTTGIVGIVIASMDLWCYALGDFLIDCGDDLATRLSMMSFFS